MSSHEATAGILGASSRAGLRGLEALVRSRWLLVALGVLAGLVLGAAVAMPGLLPLLLGALAGALLVVAIVRWPELGPALFWIAFALQGTLFGGLVVTGLYYPIYALMALNVVLALGLGRLALTPRLMAYAGFLLLVAVSVLHGTDPLGFDGYQRLFIYVLGFLAFFQFPLGRPGRLLTGAQVAASLVVAGWVLVNAFESGFGYRAAISANQNVVSFMLGFGLLALLARPMAGPAAGRWQRLAAVATWPALGVGIYALLVLASRGISVAFAVAAVSMFGRILLPARRSLRLLLSVAAVGVVLVALPGSDALFQRFQEANVATANDRLPLWSASLDTVASSNVYELLFGHGFESSERVVSRVRAQLTSTHNAYLQVLLEFGLLGLLAFLWLHLALLRTFWRSRSSGNLQAGGVLVFMLMADLTMTAPDQFLYWVALGQLLAMAAASDRAPPVPEGSGAVPRDEEAPAPSGSTARV